MPVSEDSLKIAVFIDFDNIEIGVKTTLNREFEVGAVLDAVKERGDDEQIAGLLHDISTSAFSHIVDWTFAQGSAGKENYQDVYHQKFIRNTEIPKVLTKHGFRTERIFDLSNFTLLDSDIPNLCADRVDYALREFFYWLDLDSIRFCLRYLVNLNGEMIFIDNNAALKFAKNSLKLQSIHWGGEEAVRRYYYFSNMMRVAIRESVVNKNFFYNKNESEIMTMIEKSENVKIHKLLNILSFKPIHPSTLKGGSIVYKKFRYVDPKVLVGGKLIRLSVLNSNFKETLEKHKRVNKKGVVV